jgi:predicted nucleic acid-binding protein
LHDALERVSFIAFADDVIAIAGQSFGMPLKTLDAVHLATAIAWRDSIGEDVSFATHDTRLAAAARSMGFQVLGAG